MQKIDANRSALFNKTARRKLGDRDHGVLAAAIQHGPKKNGANGGLDARRAALASAIAKRDEAKRELTATDRAVDGALARVNAARDAIEAADKRIEEAKHNAAKDLVIEQMTGEPPSGNAELNDARAARQQAQDALDAAFQAHATLTRQRTGTSLGGGPANHLAYAEADIRRAVEAVVAHDPVVAAILKRWDEVSYEHATLFKLLEWLAPNMLPESHKFWRARFDDHELEMFQAFKAAVKALETDPNTPLPKIEMQEVKAAPPPKPRDEAPARPGVNRYGGAIR